MRIAGHERLTGGAALSRDHPVVAAATLVGIADDGAGACALRTAAEILARVNDALLVRLPRQERAVERPVAQRALAELGNGDDGKASGEIPTPVGLDRERVVGRPGPRLVSEQVELDRETAAAFIDDGVDAARESLEELQRLGRQVRLLPLRNPVEPDRAADEVGFQRFRAKNLREPAVALAPQVVELKQSVLRHGVSEPEEEVVVGAREDVRDA